MCHFKSIFYEKGSCFVWIEAFTGFSVFIKLWPVEPFYPLLQTLAIKTFFLYLCCPLVNISMRPLTYSLWYNFPLDLDYKSDNGFLSNFPNYYLANYRKKNLKRLLDFLSKIFHFSFSSTSLSSISGTSSSGSASSSEETTNTRWWIMYPYGTVKSHRCSNFNLVI